MISDFRIMRKSTGSVRRATRAILRSARALGNIVSERRAQQLGRSIEASGLVVSDTLGYVSFATRELGISAQVSKLASLAVEWTNDPVRNKGDKPFLRNLLSGQDLLDFPEFLDVAMHPVLYGAVTKYLGQAPWLVSMSLWLSPPNQTAVRSQLYHYDHKDTRQAKIFINLNDVAADCGPLHFLPASESVKVDKTAGYSQGRYTDEEVYGAVAKSKVIATVGNIGTGFIVDTARCLHYGSRGNARERLMLKVNFARVNCVDPGSGCEVLDPVRSQLIREKYSTDPARAFSIGNH
jgi:hypothetical protein